MKSFSILFCFLFVFGACDSLKENFEDIENGFQPVVECYLVANAPLQLTLSKSEGFFAPFDTSRAYWQQIALINDAQVVISGDGFLDTLKQVLSFDFSSNRVFNYISTRSLPDQIGATFHLDVKLKNGETIKGSTILLPSIPIDSMKYSYSPDFPTYARAITNFSEPQGAENYYQYILRYDRSYDTLPSQNLPFPDLFFNTPNITLFGPYDLVKGQKAIGTLIHISEDYHDFLRSINLAILGSQSPIVQPSPIQSNVWGTANPIGIFTAISVARDTVLIE